MFLPNTLIQAIGLALLQEGTMEAILKEAKGLNRGGMNTINFLGSRKSGDDCFPQSRGFQQQKCKKDEPGSYIIIATKSLNLVANAKGSKIYMSEREEREEEAPDKGKNDVEDKNHVVSLLATSGCASHYHEDPQKYQEQSHHYTH